jgi:uncharacterized protein YqiB (DUF1249 family)
LDFEYIKLKSKGYMDLHIDKLTEDTIAISHTYRQNGDSIPDPDMELRIIRCNGKSYLEAMTFQNSLIYQEVYPEPGKFYPKLKRQLNSFLKDWLNNLITRASNTKPRLLRRCHNER